MKWITKVFQDIDGDPSSKRLALFVFILLFIVIVTLIYFRAVDTNQTTFLQGALDKLSEMIKWFGGFVASEQVSAKLTTKKEGG